MNRRRGCGTHIPYPVIKFTPFLCRASPTAWASGPLETCSAHEEEIELGFTISTYDAGEAPQFLDACEILCPVLRNRNRLQVELWEKYGGTYLQEDGRACYCRALGRQCRGQQSFRGRNDQIRSRREER